MADDTIPIKLGQITWQRDRAKEPRINLVNRYFEENPVNQIDQVALLTRPALARRTVVGSAAIRAMYQQDGCFGNNAFVVSGIELYRVAKSALLPDVVTVIGGEVWLQGQPVMSAAEVSGGSEFLFICDGRELQVYDPLVGPNLAQVLTPDDVPIISVAYIAGYTICVVGNSQRFYWIEPGEKIIDPLNFAEAERSPDWLLQALPLGDQVGLFGKKTTEFWYPSGDPTAPFQRMQGRLFERGIWDGTALQVGDAIIVVGNDGVVYSIEGGPRAISYPGIEERIRTAMKVQELEFARQASEA